MGSLVTLETVVDTPVLGQEKLDHTENVDVWPQVQDLEIIVTLRLWTCDTRYRIWECLTGDWTCNPRCRVWGGVTLETVHM